MDNREKPVVLVVDDEQSLRKFIRTATAAEGRPFLTASNLESAMRVIKEHSRQYMVVFLDYKLQAQAENGLQLLRHIQEEASHRVIAYIWTGDLTSEIETEAIAAGAYGAFSKSECPPERMICYTTPASAPLQHLMAAKADFLTGLLNYQTFREKTIKAFRGATQERNDPKLQRRQPDVFTFLLMDMDRFKTVNDTHGHDVGSLAIQAVGVAIQNHVRETDLVGRYGGDEFMVLLLGETVTTAEPVRKHIMQGVSEARVFDHSGRRVSLRISVAGAQIRREELQDPDKDFDELFIQADEVLKAVKPPGR